MRKINPEQLLLELCPYNNTCSRCGHVPANALHTCAAVLSDGDRRIEIVVN